MCDSQVLGKKGIRCTVCTGCGRCLGVERIHILTKRMQPFAVDLRNNRGVRLVTADVGTTTIAMQLHGENGSAEDTFAAVNPQHIYGADVISRIAAAGKSVDAAKDMKRMVQEVLQKGIRRFQSKLGVGESLFMVVSANTTMVYLLMGRSVEELGRAPFTANHLEGVETVLAGVPTFIMPGLSAFVGGDIVAGIHASGMLHAKKPVLLVDLGTNGEMVLGNEERIFACATAAGPAFEGGVNRGVWGSDMVHFLAELRREGLLDETGLLLEAYFDSGVRIGNVCVTQDAVRAVQLAKAAISAGIEILRKEYGCEYNQIERVILAGGFGYYLSPEDAACIGLLPGELAKKTLSGGNTALAGALYIGETLLQRKEGQCMSWEGADIRNRKGVSVQIINLAEQIGFEKEFLNAISL